MKPNLQIELPAGTIAAFCRKWKITRLEVFGSALRDDFRPDSDIDFLATFAPDSRWSLFDIVRMHDELADIVHRPVDLVERSAVENSPNPFRKRSILESTRTIYASAA
jgi:predicted nucleotidyltransferase